MLKVLKNLVNMKACSKTTDARTQCPQEDGQTATSHSKRFCLGIPEHGTPPAMGAMHGAMAWHLLIFFVDPCQPAMGAMPDQMTPWLLFPRLKFIHAMHIHSSPPLSVAFRLSWLFLRSGKTSSKKFATPILETKDWIMQSFSTLSSPRRLRFEVTI